jgi:PIN domain
MPIELALSNDFNLRAKNLIPNYVLIDYENVHVKSLALLKGEQFRVRVFLGKSNTKIHSELAIAMQKLGDRADYIMLESSGSNALDFHIAYYLGVLAAADPAAHFYIISKDKGFDPLVEHLKTRGMYAVRSVSIEAMSGVTPAEELPRSLAKKSKAASPVKGKAKSIIGKISPAQEAQIKAVIENLKNRKSARPTKMPTLLNTIHAKIGKERPLAEAEAVRDMLLARSYVSVSGLKVTYNLPADE